MRRKKNKRNNAGMQSCEKTATLIRKSYSRKKSECYIENNFELEPITMQIKITQCLQSANH